MRCAHGICAHGTERFGGGTEATTKTLWIMRQKRTIRTAAFAASLAAWCGWGMTEVKAQADAWIIGNSWARMEGAQTGATIAVASLPAPGGPLGYSGAPANRSQHVRTNGEGQLIFFAVDGNLYDGDGFLIADARAQGCQQCLEPGVMEFVSVPIPGHCGLYYLFAARATTQFSTGFIQLSILDMNADNTAYGGVPPGSCNARKGRLLELSEEVYDRYPGLTAWGGLGYIWENTNVSPQDQVPSSLFVSRLDQEEIGKSQAPQIRVVQGQAPNEPTLLFAIMTTRVYVYRISNSGIERVNTVPAGTLQSIALGYMPLWYPYDADWTDKQYKYDSDARRIGNGQVRLAITANYGMHALPDVSETYNLLSMRFNASTGAWIPGSSQGFRINPPPNACTSSPAGLAQGGLVGCAISSTGASVLISGEFTDNCTAWYPYFGRLDLASSTITDLTASIPNAGAYTRARFYRNRAPGASTEGLYIPHASGTAVITGWETSATPVFLPNALPGALPPVFAGSQATYYMPRFLNTAVQGDSHLSASNLAQCCTYFQTVPGAVAGGFTRTAGQSNWNGATNEAQPGSNVVVFNCDVVIEPGGRLFASNMTWKFTDNAKVIVKPGGYLDLNNCTLTSITCYQARWPGVEVWGNATFVQNGTGAYQIPTYQGKLNAVNTTIENAQIGVLAGRRNSATGFTTYPLTGGAVILMNGSTVRNCERGVDFRQYPYLATTTGTLPQPNLSRFTRTNFLTTNPQGGAYTFTTHARLDRVNGIQFKQCTFKNTVADAWYAAGSNPLGSVRLGYGIESYESEFKVWPGCNAIIGVGQDCPAANVLPTVFEGLDHGIHALGGPNALRNFTVDRATFNKNICGVYTSGVIGFVAKRNNITLGNRNVPLTGTVDANFSSRHRGIYSFEGYGFIVEDNTLTQAGTNPTEGIVIADSKEHNDMVFRNNAINLERGYIGEGQCIDPLNRAVTGLHFQCNTNNGVGTNFWSRLIGNPSQQQAANQSIRTNQGLPNRPADNTFDQEPGRMDFRNDGCGNNVIAYWWTLPETPYKPMYTLCVADDNNVNGQLISRPNGNCASRLARVTIPVGVDGLMAHAQTEKLAYGEVRYLYQQLIDGGDRDEVVSEITSAWPQDAWDLRAYLLSKSPFLSTEVLKGVVNKAGFPMAMKAEVCIANPDATKQDGFMKWLEYEAAYPMPENLLASIEASWDAKTFRTALEANMADRHGELTQALNLATEALTRDTINDPLDSYGWLGRFYVHLLHATLKRSRSSNAEITQLLPQWSKPFRKSTS